MRGQTVQVFDEFISGTSSTWYTSATFNEILRNGDAFAIQAVTMAVGGSSPTLTVRLEQSEDNEHWVQEATPVINSQSIANNGSYGKSRTGEDPVLSSFARFAVTLGGSSPKCRLKLYVTVRAYSATRGAAATMERQP